MSREGGADTAPDRRPNRLINEQSPYLRQHAYNPVDWYPWGDEALKRARLENKPLLLSIGYSACHWCHVMERESFENEEIARLMNERFVPVKVDREERPDLDQVYMDAVQLITGRGGWPLTVFLTPEGKPFYGGTYFPPEDSRGMPGFRRILLSVAEAYDKQAPEVGQNVDALIRALGELSDFTPAGEDPSHEIVSEAVRAMVRHYDENHGGIGGAPKFPSTFVFSLLLRVFRREKNPRIAEMVRHTLTRMGKGGIYDQIGGGFHRYSVDEKWLVPHFEKMLYDQALISRLYLDAGRALGDPAFFKIARGILDYVLREMTSPEGGFYCSQDADSEGEEGKFFLWTPAQAREAVGDELAPIAMRYFDVSEEGNFEGANILHRTIEPSDVARIFKLTEEQVNTALDTIVERMFAARERRVKPERDDKIVVAWNAMMVSAFAEGYRALGEPRYLEAARRAVDFVMNRLWDGNRLKRSFRGGVARFNAYLEDYALMANAMLDVYEASVDTAYLESARALTDRLLEHFLDDKKGGFFFTSDDHEELLTRSKTAFDGSTPSGNSAAAFALIRLQAYTGIGRYLTEAERTLKLFLDHAKKQPLAFAYMLAAVDFYAAGATEVVFVAGRDAPELRSSLGSLGRLYVPDLALFVADPSAPDGTFVPEAARGKRPVDNLPTAYVCRERTCSLPLTSFDQIEAALAKRPPLVSD